MKVYQLLRNTIHFIHATHWRGPQAMSKKQLRRFNYWNRQLERRWDCCFAEFFPRKPRGKRLKAHAAWIKAHNL